MDLLESDTLYTQEQLCIFPIILYFKITAATAFSTSVVPKTEYVWMMSFSFLHFYENLVLFMMYEQRN